MFAELELLDEVEEILSCCEPEEFSGFCASLFRCLAKRMSSQHYQVLDCVSKKMMLD